MKSILKKFGRALVVVCATISFAQAAPKWKKVISNAASSNLQGGFMEFKQNGTFVVPAGVTKIHVNVIGAGGGGGANAAGGGGGGGSCIKNGATVLSSANGGAGGPQGKSGSPGASVYTALTVSAGATLSIFVGGGGGGASYVAGTAYAGSGGYGPCGVSGSGGSGGVGAVGVGGSDIGGGGGSTSAAGATATTSTGGGGANCSTGGGSESGNVALTTCGTGGNSGGIGGCLYASVGVALRSAVCGYTTAVTKEPGEPGTYGYVFVDQTYFVGTGGGPGAVYIWW